MGIAALESGLRIYATANHATSAVATLTGVAGTYIYVTDISASSDKAAARIVVKDGSTVIWQDRISNGGAYLHHFETALRASIGANITVTTDGTAECNSNVNGVQL